MTNKGAGHPRTGLRETWNERFEVPVVHQKAFEALDFSGHAESIHTVPIEEVPSLDFYARLAPSDELYVSFQGAVMPGKLRYPSFWRVASMRNRAEAFMAFADPTLLLTSNEAFGLGWYTGGEGWDPLEQIANVVRQAMTYSGAKRVMFLGGSGGGFAAMRMATKFPGSIAFVQDPQTTVAAYHMLHKERLVEGCWPGRQLEDVLARHPERFDLLHVYQKSSPQNYVYYRQSTRDRHLKKHCEPFMEAVKGAPGMIDDRYRFVLEEGEKKGHGAITNAEFSRHFRAAVRWWRSRVAH